MANTANMEKNITNMESMANMANIEEEGDINISTSTEEDQEDINISTNIEQGGYHIIDQDSGLEDLFIEEDHFIEENLEDSEDQDLIQ